MKIVLKWSTSDQHAIARVKDAHDLGQHGILILDAVCFVNDDVLPRDLFELSFLQQANFVWCDADFEIDWLEAVLNEISL